MKTNSLKGCPRAPDGLEQTGSPGLIPGPRIRSYDARPNSFLNGIGAGRPCTSLGSPLVRPDFAVSPRQRMGAPAWWHPRGRRDISEL